MNTELVESNLSFEKLFTTIVAMNRFGGNFYKHLGQAVLAADPTNRKRLLIAFPEIIEKYGPGTSFFNEVDK